MKIKYFLIAGIIISLVVFVYARLAPPPLADETYVNVINLAYGGYVGGLTIDNGNFWFGEAVPSAGDHVYKFSSTGALISNFDVGWTTDLDNPDTNGVSAMGGITRANSYLYILDDIDDYVYSTDYLGNRVTTNEFYAIDGKQIVSNGTDFWIGVSGSGGQNKIYHYYNKTLVNIISVTSSGYLMGATTNGTDFWVINDDKIIRHFNNNGTLLDADDYFVYNFSLGFVRALTSPSELTGGNPTDFYIMSGPSASVVHYHKAV